MTLDATGAGSPHDPAALPDPERAAARLQATVRRAALALVVLIVAGFVVFAVGTHRATLERAGAEIEQIDALLADSASRLFEAVDSVLISMLEGVQGHGPSGPFDAMPPLLRRAVAGMPMLYAVFATDADGVMRFNSNRPEAVGRTVVADRDYFTQLRDGPPGALMISDPLRARLADDARIVIVARRITLRDGGFGGIVAAVLSVAHFERIFAAGSLEDKDASVALMRRDGMVLARHPPLPPDLPNPPPGLVELIARFRGTGVTLLRAPGSVDGEARLITGRPLRDDQLALGVTVSESAVLRPWRRDTLLAAGLAAGLSLAILLTWRFIAAQIRRGTAATAALGSSEAALRLRNAELHAIYEGAPVGLCLCDRSLRYLAVNPRLASIHGLRPEQMIGHTLRSLRPAAADRIEPMLRRVLETGEPANNVELHYASAREPDERRSWLSSCRALRDGQGAIVGVAVAVLDISDLRRAEMAQKTLEANLRRSERLTSLGELTGGLAHDFNNLLTIMLGNLEMLHEMCAGDAETMDLLQEIETAAQRGSELTRSLLAFARRQPLAPQPVEVNALVESTVKLLRRTLGERIEIQLALAAGPVTAMVDRAQLESALTNLATNARDAMPQGGRLTIATDLGHLEAGTLPPDVASGDYVVITVTDEGTGMTPEVRARLFEPFFTTKRPGAGTGLGLSMVFGFLKQSGGHVEVESEIGSGTTFRLYLPRETAAADAAGMEPAARAEPGGERVLVVEDDEMLRRAVVREVSRLGYAVTQAVNAAEALAILERGTPIDLVFSDIVMPGRLDGYDLAAIVGQRWPHVRLLLTSGFPGSASAHAGRVSRAVELLAKPYRRDALARALRAALDRGAVPASA